MVSGVDEFDAAVQVVLAEMTTFSSTYLYDQSEKVQVIDAAHFVSENGTCRTNTSLPQMG